MYFKFPCTGCGKNLKAREEHIGRRVGCPYCRAAVVVPAPAPLEPVSEPPSLQIASSSSPAAPSPAAAPPRTPSRKPSAASSSAARSDGTNVSLLLTGLLGLAMTVSFYLLLVPIQHTYFAQLFVARGWVPYAEVFLMMWSLAVLIQKYRKLARQRASMLFDLLPTELSEEITVGNTDAFTRHVRGLPADPGESFLINRVLRGLEHFRVRKSAPEAASILASQSEMDASAVYSSYTMLKVFIWAIPILGFIGTVIGISLAVGAFSGSLGGTSDLDVLKDALNNVTSGLATAFDTTLLALMMSMLIKFPASSLQKSEEDMLGWVDEYCNENLLKRLNDGREGGAERGSGGGRSAIQQAVDGAMREHHAELRAWTEKLAAIGDVLSDKMADRWTQINAQVGEQMQTQYATRLEEAEKLAAMGEQFQRTLSEVRTGIASLNDLLGSLGEKQIVVEVSPAPELPQRRWRLWNSRGVKKNGSP